MVASEPIYYLAKETQHIVIIIFGYHIVCQIMNYFLAKTHITHSLIACVQTSPVSSVARGKGTTKEIRDVWTQANSLKADTHEGFCSRSMLQYHFARVSTHEGALFAPGACSQIFNWLNIVEHFAQKNKTAPKKTLPFITQYHPALPNLKDTLMGKWHLIENQPQLREIFKEPPIISYRKGKSLKDILVKAKL